MSIWMAASIENIYITRIFSYHQCQSLEIHYFSVLLSCILWCHPINMCSSNGRLWLDPMWWRYVSNFLYKPHQVIQLWMVAQIKNIMATTQVEDCYSHICTLHSHTAFAQLKWILSWMKTARCGWLFLCSGTSLTGVSFCIEQKWGYLHYITYVLCWCTFIICKYFSYTGLKSMNKILVVLKLVIW